MSLFFHSFAGKLVLLWRRGVNVLTASEIMVTQDERIKLVNGYNLEIAELEPQDAGDYVCQISDKVNRDQVHTVEILGKHSAFFHLLIKIVEKGKTKRTETKVAAHDSQQLVMKMKINKRTTRHKCVAMTLKMFVIATRLNK